MSKKFNVYLLIVFLMFGSGIFIWLTYLPEADKIPVLEYGEKEGLLINPDGPRYGGVFRIAMAESLSFKDPIEINNEFQQSLAQQLYNRLCYIDTNGKVQRELLSHLDWDRSNSSLVFILRRGIILHNGQELTAKEVVVSFNEYLKNQSFRRLNGSMNSIMGIEEINRYAFRISLTGEESEIIGKICQMPVFIFHNEDDGVPPEVPYGTGPFMFESKVKDREWVLKANPDYFLGRPYLDKIVYWNVMDLKTVSFMFLQKEIEQAWLSRGGILNQPYVRIDSRGTGCPESFHQVRLLLERMWLVMPSGFFAFSLEPLRA